jgi:hypothetical protein
MRPRLELQVSPAPAGEVRRRASARELMIAPIDEVSCRRAASDALTRRCGLVDAPGPATDNARAMPGPLLASLKGRDLRALTGFRDRVRASLGKRLHAIYLLGRRALDVPAEAALPARAAAGGGPATAGARPGGAALALAPAPEPPGELLLLVEVERRDLWVEEQVDAAALEVALATGALVLPLVRAEEEVAGDAARAAPLAARRAVSEEVP